MGYVLAGLATASGGAMSAEGEIHYSGRVNYKFDKRSPGTESHVFPLSQGAGLQGYRYVRGAVDNSAGFYFQGPVVSAGFRGPRYFSSSASALPRGELISHARFTRFGSGRLQDYACEFRDWQEPGTYYAGFRFNTGAGVQFGWVRVKWGGCSYNGFIVLDYAWGDPGDKVKTGQKQLREDETQVEPEADMSADGVPLSGSLGTLGLLALGAVGLRAWRKSRAGSTDSAAP
jgi:hypothetical protein